MIVKIGNKEDIKAGTGKIIETNEKEIAVFNINGKFFAIDNRCLHRGGPLGEGSLDGNTVTCPWHSWQFDIESGSCLTMPGAKVNSYKVVVKNDEIFIEV